MFGFVAIEEVWALLRIKFLRQKTNYPRDGNRGFCYDMLNKVSRSFSAVTMELPPELREPVCIVFSSTFVLYCSFNLFHLFKILGFVVPPTHVCKWHTYTITQICIFYLVLRALDTVEDDTSFDKKIKLPLLRDFHNKIGHSGFHVKDCGQKKSDRELMENFLRVSDVYLGLKEKYRVVIKDITQRMGFGMAQYIDSEVVTIEDYNLYCHYVAGLVGLGLTRLFVESGFEDGSFDSLRVKANAMGLFLQKTNITRDYYEDILEGRIFWPKEVWSLYATDIKDFKDPKNIKNAVFCLNHLVTDALTHAQDCLDYMNRLKNQEIFNFCAIPQVMAIATLAEIYNNPDVFKKNVKIRKGLAVRLMNNTTNIKEVGKAFNHFARQIEKKIDSMDPNAEKTKKQVESLKNMTSEFGSYNEGTSLVGSLVVSSFLAISGAVAFYYFSNKK